jgi:hypothetical protein
VRALGADGAPIEGSGAGFVPDRARHPERRTYCLSPADIAEIEAATAVVRAHPLDTANSKRAEVPLSSLGATLDRRRDD